ncbi:MFS transporter [Natronosalvus caseinilyticus]|uniref:MFS transporter n=1 Tax=Natronosalvus caseinilyticus TaxID=2953747 RepID=UPI0028AF4992|nr:MFS transporter [Natronosalvus caseinilyticus]
MAADDRVAVHEATTEFLEDRDDGEATLEAVLETDSARETWTFDDVPVNSGTFGELVSRGIVEKADGEYQVSDPKAVRAALEGESLETEFDAGAARGFLEERSLELGIWGDRRALAGLAGALVFLFAMRIVQYGSVFRGDDVLSPGNDPYFYRYWMEDLLSRSTSPTDIGLLAEMPAGAMTRRPLTHAANWWFATLLGGDQWAADMVAAWLPVVATVALGVVVYALAVVVTRDVRVGVASVVLLAVAPVHAVYTQLGFLEHRLHQYFWLGVTLLALALLAADFTRRRAETRTEDAIRGHLESPVTWVVSIGLGLALGISIHLWGGSPLLFMPLAAYVALRVLVDVRESISPTLANLPLLAGLAIGAGLSIWAHTSWGWRLAFVAYTPAMVLGGAIVVVALGELWRSLDLHVGGLAALEVGVVGIGLYALRRLRPEDWANARGRADDLFLREGYTESASLFTPDYMVIFGPLVQLGVGFYLGVAVLAWAVWLLSREYEPAWLVLAVYTVFFTVLAGIQIRFAAQLMIPVAVLGGIGFVYVLSVVDLARRPRPFREESSRAVAADGRTEPSIDWPERRQVLYVLGTGLLVCGFGLLFVPGLTGQITYSEGQHGATAAIEEHALETDREYPETFVLSEWGDNRMYNYFVNGESRSYSYARSNYGEFVGGASPDEQYEQISGRVGYVVVTNDEGTVRSGSTHEQFLQDNGSVPELGHYQAISLSDSSAAYAVVPGATINATVSPNERVSVRTTVEVDGQTLEYGRDGEADGEGRLEVTVAYPGTYEVGDRNITVTQANVEAGEAVAGG